MSNQKPRSGKPVVKDHGGDELTRLQSTNYVPEEGLPLILAPHRAGEFTRRLQKLRDECDKILIVHKLPPSGNTIVEHDGKGNWRPQRAGTRSSSRRFSGWATASNFAITFSKPFTPEWYAAKLGSLAFDVLTAVEAGKVDQTTFFDLVEIGDLERDRAWRFKYRKTILRGAKVREGSKRGAASRRDGLAPRTAGILAGMKEYIDQPGRNRSTEEAAKAVLKRGLGTSAGANARLWYRHQSKKV